MTRYSVPPRDQIFVTGYEFLSFAKNMGKNRVETIITTQLAKLRYNGVIIPISMVLLRSFLTKM